MVVAIEVASSVFLDILSVLGSDSGLVDRVRPRGIADDGGRIDLVQLVTANAVDVRAIDGSLLNPLDEGGNRPGFVAVRQISQTRPGLQNAWIGQVDILQSRRMALVSKGWVLVLPESGDEAFIGVDDDFPVSHLGETF